MKTLSRLVLVAVGLGLSGCVPFPHTSIRFPEMEGHVIDFITQKPIAGATVAIAAEPKVSTTSDASGKFRIERQVNFLPGYYIPGICGPTDWGEQKNWGTTLVISAPGYSPAKISTLRDNIVKTHDKKRDSYILYDVALDREKK